MTFHGLKSIVPVCFLVLIQLSGAGCFRKLDANKLTCDKASACPGGYYCALDKKKCLPLGATPGIDGSAGGALDGPIDRSPLASGGAGGTLDLGAGGTIVAAGGAGGTSVPLDLGSGGAIDSGGTTEVDAPLAGTSGTDGAVPTGGTIGQGGTGGSGSGGATTLSTGASCTTDTQCTLGFCVDGVCCDSRCASQCQACAETGSVGKCTTVTSGNPRGTRAACGGTDKCKGSCDGSSATSCKMPGNETVCQNETCAQGQHAPASHCSGAGTCPPQSALPCASGTCATDGSNTCAGACSSTSCPTGQYCASNGSCATKKPSGTGNTCTTGTECASTFCSPDGVCCQTDCPGECKTCNNASGQCLRVGSGQPAAPRVACTNATDPTCGGRCTATSDSCFYPGTTTSCGTDSCATPGYTSKIAPVCDAAGACNASATSACTGGQVCVSGSCTSKIATNSATACLADVQCASGHCCSGTCRDFSTDSSNCNGCGIVCPSSTPICNAATCGCAQGQLNCGTGCVDILKNNIHCGNCTTSCNTQPGYVCTSGSCSCAGKLITECGCLAWNFNNNDSQNWSWGGGVRGDQCSVPSAGVGTPPIALDGGAFSLQIPSGDGMCGTSASLPLCANGAPLSGLTLTAQLLFAGSSAYAGTVSPFSDYNSSSGNATSYWQTTPSPPFAANTWVTISATLGSQPDGAINTDFGIMFYPGTWVGTVWIDNVVIK